MTFPLTAGTTEADLTAPITAARTRLSQAALQPEVPIGGVERLVDMVNEVFAQEAVARARFEIVSCLKHHEDSTRDVREAALLRLFVSILYRKTDDEWSGRKNDARRAANDAVKVEIADQRWALLA